MSDQDSFVVQVRPTVQDYEFLQREVWRPVKANLRNRVLSLANLVVLIGIVAIAAGILVDRSHMPVWAAAIISLCLAALVSNAISVATRPLFFRSYLDPKGFFLAGYEARVDSDGLHLSGAWGESRYLWKGILNVKETTTHIFVFVDRSMAVAIPKIGFGSQVNADRFVERLQARGGSGEA